MSSRNPALCRAFIKESKEILAQSPHIVHSWSIYDDKDHCLLDFPKIDADGFDITVEVVPDQVFVYGSGFHEHFDTNDNKTKIESALGLVRDLLSPDMRIREYLAGDRPYRWDLETIRDGKWITEHTTGRLFWNYFRKRSQKFYQNKVLAGRMNEK